MRTVLVRLAILCSVLLASCWMPEPPSRDRVGGPIYQRNDPRGKKVLLLDKEGDMVAKLRRRDVSGTEWTVYDPSLRKSGQLQWANQREGWSLRWLPLGDAQPVAAVPDDFAVQMGDLWRVESVEDGWALFDGRNALLGYADFGTEGDWTLRSTYNALPHATVQWNAESARFERWENNVLVGYTFDREVGPAWLLLRTLSHLSEAGKVSMALTLISASHGNLVFQEQTRTAPLPVGPAMQDEGHGPSEDSGAP